MSSRTLIRATASVISRCKLGYSCRQTSQVVKTQSETELEPFRPIQESHKQFLDELRPPMKRSFNLAAYVNHSKTLQELLKLGVSLYDIENTNPSAAKHIAGLDFQKDCVPYIKLLVDSGLKPKNLGRFISEYPSMFSVPLEDLALRIDYLVSKRFSKDQIASALNRSSAILSLNIKSLDFKLGQLQIEFDLSAAMLRDIVSKYPPIAAVPSGQYKLIYFCLYEEFGFTKHQMHKIICEQPRVIDMLRPTLIERLDLVHNTIGLSHATITQFPKLIVGPRFDIKHRSDYLRKLKRDQYDPTKPLYVSPSALYNETDEDFCKKYAKTDVEDYRLFVKSC